MNSELLEPVRFVVAEVMETELAGVSAESTNLNLEGWDSLRHLKLVSALTETFEIEIEDGEIESCLEVRGIVELVGRKLG